jgi:hypothetical protein
MVLIHAWVSRLVPQMPWRCKVSLMKRHCPHEAAVSH